MTRSVVFDDFWFLFFCLFVLSDVCGASRARGPKYQSREGDAKKGGGSASVHVREASLIKIKKKKIRENNL